MKQLFFSVALASAVVVGAASAQTPPSPASHDPAAVLPGTYAVDPNHTQVLFGISHMGFSEYHGRFSGVGGDLKLDPRDVAASSLDVTIPVASISTTSEKLDDELKSADWLDAAQYPQMHFRSTKITPTGAGSARIEGLLTLHGQTHPVTLQAHFIGAGTDPIAKAYTVGFSATGALARSAFGVKTYVPLIGNQVTLTIAGAFHKQG